MVYVVNESTKAILFKIDAWDVDAEDTAIKWARDNGYKPISSKITMMGDMIIWVR